MEVAGRPVRYLESGAGPNLLALHAGASGGLAAGYLELARRLRLVVMEPPDAALPDGARALRDAAAALRLDRYAVMGEGAAGELALRLGLESGSRLERLVLVSPSTGPGAGLDPDLERRLQELEVPTLVLLGSDDEASAEAGRAFQERLSRCFLVLAYEAGPDVARDRPAAFASAVGDFVQWGERFTVSHQSQELSP